jgi:hypothetical protein
MNYTINRAFEGVSFEDIDSRTRAALADNGFGVLTEIDVQGCCQTNANQSLQGQYGCPLCRAKTAPLGESGGAVQLESRSGSEAALRVEMVADRGMDGGEFLQTSHPPEAQHRPFSSSEWQVRVLGPIVQPATRFLAMAGTDFP